MIWVVFCVTSSVTQSMAISICDYQVGEITEGEIKLKSIILTEVWELEGMTLPITFHSGSNFGLWSGN